MAPDPLHVDPDRVPIDEPLLRRLHAQLFDPATAPAALAAAGGQIDDRERGRFEARRDLDHLHTLLTHARGV